MPLNALPSHLTATFWTTKRVSSVCKILTLTFKDEQDQGLPLFSYARAKVIGFSFSSTNIFTWPHVQVRNYQEIVPKQ